MRSKALPFHDTADLGIFALMATALTPPLGAPQQRARIDNVPTEAAPPAPGLLDRLDTWLWRMEQRALEEYLGKAQDIYDLEARIRGLERAAPSRNY